MNLKVLFISMLILIPCWSCEKKGDLIDLYFNETWCANPWSVSTNDADYINKVKSFLAEKNIIIKEILISNDGPFDPCKACFCPTGRRINIQVSDKDKNLALGVGFYSEM